VTIADFRSNFVRGRC